MLVAWEHLSSSVQLHFSGDLSPVGALQLYKQTTKSKLQLSEKQEVSLFIISTTVLDNEIQIVVPSCYSQTNNYING